MPFSGGRGLVLPRKKDRSADEHLGDALRLLSPRTVGFVDATGKLAIPPGTFQTDDLPRSAFDEGLGAVLAPEGWIFIDPTGTKIAGPFTKVDYSHGGITSVQSSSGERIYFRRGRMLSEFEKAEFPSEDRVAVYVEKKGWGYADLEGKVILPPQFKEARQFRSGLAVVLPVEGKLFGAVDLAGNLVVPYRFEDLGTLSEELIAAKSAGRWGYADRHGTFVIQPRFVEATPFSEGLAVVRVEEKGGLVYIDREGRQVIPRESDKFKLYEAGRFSEGRAAVDAYDQKGYLDRAGTWIYQRPGDEIYTHWPFVEGRAWVGLEKDRLWGQIDREGKVVLPFVYDHHPDFPPRFIGGIAEVDVGDRNIGSQTAYIDTQGNYIHDPRKVFDSPPTFDRAFRGEPPRHFWPAAEDPAGDRRPAQPRAPRPVIEPAVEPPRGDREARSARGSLPGSEQAEGAARGDLPARETEVLVPQRESPRDPAAGHRKAQASREVVPRRDPDHRVAR